jgi:predicted MFS family arabinose efflux permease
VFGAGAVTGPLLTGRLADRIGFAAALGWAFALQSVFIALPAFTDHRLALAASSLVVGAFVPGIVPLVLGRVQELLAHDPAARAAAWSAATTSFAIGQAIAAYGFAYLFGRGADGYALLFGLGAAALALALLIDRAVRLAVPAAAREGTAS